MLRKKYAWLPSIIGAFVLLLFLLGFQIAFAVTSDGTVQSHVKIGDGLNGFTETLDDGDQFGISVDDIGDLNNDGVIDLIVGSWKDDDGGADFGAAYILFMNADGTVDSSQKISMTTGGFTGPIDGADNFGQAVAGIGDLDGDGIEDIVIGERANDDGGTDRGAIWVTFLNANGTVKAEQKVSDTAGNLLSTFRNFDNLGTCIEPIADINGDSIADLAVCAPGLDFRDGVVVGTTTDQGGFYQLEMDTDGTVKDYHVVGDGGQGFPNDLIDNGDKFGTAVAVVPDMNNDGVDELAVGAPLDDDGAAEAGAVYILFMNADGTVADQSKISALTPNFTDALENGDRFGNSIDSMGDLDGDGVAEILVGSWQDDDGGTNRGAAYILFLNAQGGVKKYQKISDTQGNFTGTLNDSDFIGFSVAAFDDIDGDGFKEVAIGSFGDEEGGTDHGAVWLMFLNTFDPAGDTAITPTGVSVVIDDGATCTATASVELTLSGTNVKDYIVGNDEFFVGGEWQSFGNGSSLTIDWTLTPEEGEKTVYARFRSSTRNQSATVTDQILLDATCGQVEEPPKEEPPAEEPPEEEPEELPATGPSPVTGETEPISFVEPGDLIIGRSYDTVYYLDESLNRHPFLNETMYATWFDSFDDVKEVTDATLTVLTLAPPMNVNPRTVLVKFQSSNRVYFPVQEGEDTEWRWIVSESLAIQIFGSDWADYVIDIPPVFYPHVLFGEDINESSDIIVNKSLLFKREEL